MVISGCISGALADVARLGPYFAVSTDEAEAVDPTWRPLEALFTDPQHLATRIAHVRRTLRSDDRVAASIAFQGLAAQLVAVPFGCAVAHGVIPLLTPATLHWRPVASGPWPLWLPAPQAGRDTLPEVLDALVAPLVGAVRAQVPIAERLLRGNVASAAASAAAQVAAARPDLAGPARAAVEALLGEGTLAGAGEFTRTGFRRNSCCLYYRVPGGGLCGDCVLRGATRG